MWEILDPTQVKSLVRSSLHSLQKLDVWNFLAMTNPQVYNNAKLLSAIQFYCRGHFIVVWWIGWKKTSFYLINFFSCSSTSTVNLKPNRSKILLEVNVIKLFSSLSMTQRTEKLECFFPYKTFQPSQIILIILVRLLWDEALRAFREKTF